jgi:hypothetical protein
LTLIVFDVIGLGQTVAFEALKCGVNLANVEGPHLTSARFELLAELKAIFWALAQESE